MLLYNGVITSEVTPGTPPSSVYYVLRLTLKPISTLRLDQGLNNFSLPLWLKHPTVVRAKFISFFAMASHGKFALL